MEPVILVHCFDMDGGDWFWPRWALLWRDEGKKRKSRLVTIWFGGIYVIDEYHIDDLNSASFWAGLDEIDKIRKQFSSGFRHEEQLERLEKLLSDLPKKL